MAPIAQLTFNFTVETSLNIGVSYQSDTGRSRSLPGGEPGSLRNIIVKQQ